MRRLLYGVADHAIAIALALCFVLPLTTSVLTAFMTQRQAGTGELWPHPFVWSNFGAVFRAMPFGADLRNTVVYAALATVGTLVSSVPVAYALAKIDFPGRGALFLVVLATMMIPAQVTTVPLYVVFAKLGWIGTLKPLIVPTFFGDAFSIFLLRQFMRTIPPDVTEAAKLDGANEWQLLTRIIVPLARPAIAAVGLFAFLGAWNDFYSPLLYTGSSEGAQTLAVALSQLTKSAHQGAYQLQMAASLMFLAPVLVIFFLAQKVFVEGISLSGTKG